MKIYVRDNNTTFRLSDVERLASKWIAALDPATAQSYFSHAEQIEENLTDDDENELTADEIQNEADE